jgi:hypothetical protein
MAIVAAWGLELAWFRAQGSLSYSMVVISHSIIAWGLALIAGLAMARGFGPIILGAVRRAPVWGLLAITLLASLYLAWGHHRAMYEYIHGLDHGFPFPDGCQRPRTLVRRQASPTTGWIHQATWGVPPRRIRSGDSSPRLHERERMAHRRAVEQADMFGIEANLACHLPSINETFHRRPRQAVSCKR